MQLLCLIVQEILTGVSGICSVNKMSVLCWFQQTWHIMNCCESWVVSSSTFQRSQFICGQSTNYFQILINFQTHLQPQRLKEKQKTSLAEREGSLARFFPSFPFPAGLSCSTRWWRCLAITTSTSTTRRTSLPLCATSWGPQCCRSQPGHESRCPSCRKHIKSLLCLLLYVTCTYCLCV